MKYISKYKTKKRKFVTGGMYQPNIIQPGLNPGSTANLVFNESEPEVQEAREEKLESEIDNLQAKNEKFVADYEAQKTADAAAVQAKAAQFNAKAQAAENLVGQTVDKIGSAVLKKGAQSAGQAGRLVGQRAMNRAVKRGSQKAVGRIAKRQAARNVGGRAGKAAAGKAASAASSLLSTGSLLSIGGQLVSGLSNDNDATKWNAGEVTGDIASAAGTGMMLGSVIPGVGNVIGGIIGGLYGLGKGLIGRRKARKEKTRLESQQKARVAKHNRELREAYTPQVAMARAGEIEQKTYSGYDLGRNITASYGGLKKYI